MVPKLHAPPEVQLLVNKVMSWAEEQLKAEGRLPAAAAWLPRDNSEPGFRTLDGSAPEASIAQRRACGAELQAPWRRNELAAILLAAPVLYGRKGSAERTQAVRLHVEAGGRTRETTGEAARLLADTVCRAGYRAAGRWHSGPRNHVSSAIRWRRRTILSPRCSKTRRMPTKRKSKGAYMISAVAEMYEIHPQTLRLYEREGLLKPSRTEGNTRLYTDEDLERLELILNLARDLGVNISGIAIILQMRERMEEMNRQMQSFVDYVRSEILQRIQHAAPIVNDGAIVPLRKAMVIDPAPARKQKR